MGTVGHTVLEFAARHKGSTKACSWGVQSCRPRNAVPHTSGLALGSTAPVLRLAIGRQRHQPGAALLGARRPPSPPDAASGASRML